MGGFVLMEGQGTQASGQMRKVIKVRRGLTDSCPSIPVSSSGVVERVFERRGMSEESRGE